MHSCDESLFLALNFDGGPCLDRIMTLISGMAIWIPFYLLILWLVCRRYGWRNTLLFLAALALAWCSRTCSAASSSTPVP